VIDPDRIDHRQQRAKAFDPPRVSCTCELIPAIVRISPELASGAEVIRRHSGDDLGVAVGIETKQFLSAPDVGAVVSDEDREVAHDLDRTRVAGIADTLPMLEEQELRQLV